MKLMCKIDKIEKLPTKENHMDKLKVTMNNKSEYTWFMPLSTAKEFVGRYINFLVEEYTLDGVPEKVMLILSESLYDNYNLGCVILEVKPVKLGLIIIMDDMNEYFCRIPFSRVEKLINESVSFSCKESVMDGVKVLEIIDLSKN